MSVITQKEFSEGKKKRGRAPKVDKIDNQVDDVQVIEQDMAPALNTEAEPEETISKPEPQGVTDITMVCESAPVGKSSMAFYYNGKEVQIEVIDQIYTIPAGTPMARDIVAMLKSKGFKDVTRGFIPESTPEPVKAVDYIYTYGHPDNAPDEKVSGNVGLKVGDKEIQLEVKNGVVKTADLQVVKALERYGFYFVKKEEVVHA